MGAANVIVTGNAASCLECCEFKYLHEKWLSWIRIFLVFLGYSREMDMTASFGILSNLLFTIILLFDVKLTKYHSSIRTGLSRQEGEWKWLRSCPLESFDISSVKLLDSQSLHY